jgi:hypothetical protein
MNKKQYEEYKSTVLNFKKDHCFWVDHDKIIYDENKSQIRVHGHVTEKFKHFAELIRNKADLPPISVKALPGGLWELKEGNTRLGGAQFAKEKILVCDYQDRVLKFTDADWEDFQPIANDHEVASPNTNEDIEALIAKQIQNGNLRNHLGFFYDGNEESFVKEAAKHYRNKIYKDSGKPLAFFRRKVEKGLAGKVKSFYENYSKEKAFEFFASNTSFGGQRPGDISNNRVVYTFSSPNHANPTVIGHIAEKWKKNRDVKFQLVYHVGNMVGKNDDSIKKEREKIIKWYDETSESYPQWNLDGLYFLPQIKQGKNKEKSYDLIHAR